MRQKKLGRQLLAAPWNACSLVENSGDVRVCRKSKSDHVDRGLDFLTSELEKFGVDVPGIPETKWFGSGHVASRTRSVSPLSLPSPFQQRASETK